MQRIDLSNIQQQEGREQAGWRHWFYKKIMPAVCFLSWVRQGMVFLIYATGYNPIKERRVQKASQWASRFLQRPPEELECEAKLFLLEQEKSISSLKKSSLQPTFTILVCFYRHRAFFKACMESIQAACKYAPEVEVEVVIINDDPSVDTAFLLKEAEKTLKAKVVLRTHEQNRGICESTNEGIKLAQGEWIIHLDCDDCLAPETFSILKKTIKEHPQARFISSRAADIDERGKILSWQLRSERPQDLIKNNFASHLKAIRKDLHTDLGFFNDLFQGCQDYEMALRIAIHESICFIPNYLYFYRWHHCTQTISHSERQNLTATRIRQAYLLAIQWMVMKAGPVEWHIRGDYADNWRNSFPKTAGEALYQIHIDANAPFLERRWKLLLIQIAIDLIDQYRLKYFNKSLFFKVMS